MNCPRAFRPPLDLFDVLADLTDRIELTSDGVQ